MALAQRLLLLLAAVVLTVALGWVRHVGAAPVRGDVASRLSVLEHVAHIVSRELDALDPEHAETQNFRSLGAALEVKFERALSRAAGDGATTARFEAAVQVPNECPEACKSAWGALAEKYEQYFKCKPNCDEEVLREKTTLSENVDAECMKEEGCWQRIEEVVFTKPNQQATANAAKAQDQDGGEGAEGANQAYGVGSGGPSSAKAGAETSGGEPKAAEAAATPAPPPGASGPSAYGASGPSAYGASGSAATTAPAQEATDDQYQQGIVSSSGSKADDGSSGAGASVSSDVTVSKAPSKCACGDQPVPEKDWIYLEDDTYVAELPAGGCPKLGSDNPEDTKELSAHFPSQCFGKDEGADIKDECETSAACAEEEDEAEKKECVEELGYNVANPDDERGGSHSQHLFIFHTTDYDGTGFPFTWCGRANVEHWAMISRAQAAIDSGSGSEDGPVGSSSSGSSPGAGTTAVAAAAASTAAGYTAPRTGAAEGEKCDIHEDCASKHCKKSVFKGDGKCMPPRERKGLGSTCDDEYECLEGMICFEQPGLMAMLTRQKCHEPRHMDESCREAKNDCVDTLVCLNSLCKPALKDGDRCEKSDHCVGSLVCRTDSHTCGEGHSDGETCKSDSDCRSPLKCVDAPGAHGGKVCENTEKEDSHDSAYQEGSGSKRPSGARCQSSTDCEEGLTCLHPGSTEFDFAKCGEAIPKGSKCHDASECAPGLSCFSTGEFAGPKCLEPHPESAPCEVTEGCEEGLICNKGTNTCQKPGGVGTACTATKECEAGLFCCEEHTCREKLAIGEDCKENSDCESDVCQKAGVSSSKCEARPGPEGDRYDS